MDIGLAGVGMLVTQREPSDGGGNEGRGHPPVRESVGSLAPIWSSSSSRADSVAMPSFGADELACGFNADLLLMDTIYANAPCTSHPRAAGISATQPEVVR